MGIVVVIEPEPVLELVFPPPPPPLLPPSVPLSLQVFTASQICAVVSYVLEIMLANIFWLDSFASSLPVLIEGKTSLCSFKILYASRQPLEYFSLNL